MRFIHAFFLMVLLMALPTQAKQGNALSKAQMLAQLQSWTKEIQAWEPSNHEALERDVWIAFLYRLKFKVLQAYAESDKSLIRILEDLRDVETAPENRASSRLITYLDSLLRSIREDREITENLFFYIKDYTSHSGILRPVTPEKFMMSREYRNPGASEQAFPLELAAAAESLEVHELAKAREAELSSKATLLDAAEGNLGIGSDHVVPGDKPGFDPLSYTLEPSQIL